MTLNTMLENFNAGGIVAIGVIILSLVEIVPIKISPLAWIGKRLNRDAINKVKGIEKKLDEHIAQSYRTKILSFQDDVLGGIGKTKEQWKDVINAISAYEKYCKENNISNGLCTQASEFLTHEYQKRLKTRDFNPDLTSGGKSDEKV